MKRIMQIMGVVLLFSLAGCHSEPQKQSSARVEDIYTCSMHPQIIEHQPGNCPICGMELIKKNSSPAATTNIGLETVLKPTNRSVISSLAFISPERKSVRAPVTAYGIIEYDTRTERTISARTAGRIERMYIRYRYQEVKKGQKIMDVYSPELVTAQQDLLFLLQNDASNASFIQATKERLLALGMSEGQLQQIVKDRKPLYAVSIYSHYEGHVHEAGAMQDGLSSSNEQPNSAPLTQELSLKEGMYIQKGQPLLMIMDHHQVWAALQVFSADQSLVKTGNSVRLIPETDTSGVIEAKIDLIEPFFRPGNKTLTARVYFHNEDMLPIGSHVSATIYGEKRNSLWLPQSSVLSLGMGNVVFRKVAGGFAAHKITTGIRSGSDIEVIAGLDQQDSVAANAQYFTDSESFINSSN